MFAKTGTFLADASFEETLRLLPGRDGFVREGGAGQRQHPMHRHREMEFNLVLSGTARYILADARDGGTWGSRLAPGSLIWLLPSQDHVLVEKSPDYRHWCVVAKPALLARLPLSITPSLRAFCRTLLPDDCAALVSLCGDIGAVESGDAVRFNAGLGYLFASAWSAFKRASDGVSEQVHPAVARAIHRLRESPETDEPIDALASRCGLSAPVLSRRFREQTGLSLIAFRQRERVRRALELRGENADATWLEIALSAGFGSYASFHRAYHDVIGDAPSAREPSGTKKEPG